MTSKQDFATIVESVFGDLSAICLLASPAELATLSGFQEEVAELRSKVCQSDTSSVQVLSGCLGLVDEFVRAKWDDVIAQTYESYVAESRTKIQ